MSEVTQEPEQKVSLSQKFQTLIERFGEMENIPAFRVDAKAKLGQKLAVEAIQLTGDVIAHIEVLEAKMLQSPDH